LGAAGGLGAGVEGTEGGPVGAGVEGTEGGPVGAGESTTGAISVSVATVVAARDSRSTEALVVTSATTSVFSQGGVLNSFAGLFSGAESGSDTVSSVLDFSQGGVRGESSPPSSSSSSAAIPTLIFVAPPSAFSPWYVVRTTELESIISFSSVFPKSLRCSVNAPVNKLLPIALFNLRPASS
jgi:hypothetical protein